MSFHIQNLNYRKFTMIVASEKLTSENIRENQHEFQVYFLIKTQVHFLKINVLLGALHVLKEQGNYIVN